MRSLEVHEDVLYVGVEQDRVDPLLLPEAGLLPPEERRLREGDRELVNRDHPRLQPARDRVRFRDIWGPDARRETVRRVVRVPDRLVEVGEVPCRDDGTEDLLPRHAYARRRILEHRGPDEISIPEIGGIGATASCEHLRALRDAFLDRLHDVRRMVPRDQGAHLDVVFQRRAQPRLFRLLPWVWPGSRPNTGMGEKLP